MSIPNLYALPTGCTVDLPSHCTDVVERFTLTTGRLVWAVRVEGGDVDRAARISRDLGTPRKV